MSAMFSSFSDTVSDKIGDLSALTTTDKTSIVGGVNEINGKVEDVSNALANYASLDIYTSNSSDFPDANTVTKELVYINGFQSDLTNYPSEVSNTVSILLTRWFYYSGDLTVARMQLVFTLMGLSFCRFFDGTSWTPWQSTGVGNLSNLTTTDKSSCVSAINEVKSGLNDLIIAIPLSVAFDADGIGTFNTPIGYTPLMAYLDGNWKTDLYYMEGTWIIRASFWNDPTSFIKSSTHTFGAIFVKE